MIKKLYLDNTRSCPDGFFLVRNYQEFVDCISAAGIPEYMSLDHDLAQEHTQDLLSDANFMLSDFENITLNYDSYQEKTGYDCVQWLVNYCVENNLKLNQVVVHSLNGPGADNMVACINNYKRFCHQEPDCKRLF